MPGHRAHDRRDRRLLRRDRGAVRGARCELLRTVRYDQVFAAAFSPRPGTPADAPRRRRAARPRSAAGSTRCSTLQEGIGLERNRGVARPDDRGARRQVRPRRERTSHDGDDGRRRPRASAGRPDAQNKLVHLDGAAGAGRAGWSTVRIDHAGPYALSGRARRLTRRALPPLIVIAGATATGKTGLSLELAEAHRPAAPRSSRADSRQVYRGMDIGTAKVARGRTRAGPAPRPRPGRSGRAVQRRRLRAPRRRRARRTSRRAAAWRSSSAAPASTCARWPAGSTPTALPSDPALRALARGGARGRGPGGRSWRDSQALAPRWRPASTCATRGASSAPSRSPSCRATRRCRPRAATPARGRGSASASTRRRTGDWIASAPRAQFDAGLIEEARALRERFDPALPGVLARSATARRGRSSTARSTLEAAIADDARRNVAFAKRQRTWFRPEPDIDWLDAADDQELPATWRVARPTSSGVIATYPSRGARTSRT